MKKSTLYLKITFVILVVSNFFIVNLIFDKVMNSFFHDNIEKQNKLLYKNLKEHIIKRESLELQRELQFLIDYQFIDKIFLEDFFNNKTYNLMASDTDLSKTEQELYTFHSGNAVLAQIKVYYNKTMKLSLSTQFKSMIFFYKSLIFIITFLTVYILLKNVEKNYFNRLRAELRYKSQKEKAEKANKAKSEFLAKMSHELKTPLNGISTITDLLLIKNKDNENYHYLTLIKKSNKLLLNLMDNILDLSKFEKGLNSIDKREINIRETIDEIAELCYIKKEQYVLLTTFVSNNVPKYIITDSNKLRQILLNILINSIKFTNKGSINISVDASPDKTSLNVIVKDTGIGIKDEEKKNIFENFYQGNNSQYGGTGLGLGIVKDLLSVLKGSIALESTYGKGSEFLIKIPIDSTKTQDYHYDFEVFTLLHSKVEEENINKYLNEYNIPFYPIRNFREEVEVIEDYVYNSIDFKLLVDAKSLEEDRFIADYIKNNDYLSSKLILLYDYGSKLDTLALKNISYISKPFSINKLVNIDLEHFIFEKKFDKKILLVEDNEVNIIGTKALMQGQGMKVTVGRSLEEARALLKDEYHMIFMDIQLPDGDGLELAREIKDQGITTPIIALSAHDTNLYKQKALEAGVENFIPKPLDYKNLMSLLTVYFDQNLNPREKKCVFDKDLLTIFWSQYGKEREKLEKAILKKDRVCVLSILHKLKGSIGNFHDKELNLLISDIEFRAKNEINRKIIEDLEKVEALLKYLGR